MSIASEGNRIPQFTVGDRLRKARESAGVTQDELAQAVGLARRSIVRYEASETVRRSVLLLYAMRTGVPARWLELGVEDPGKLPDLDSNQEPIGSRARSYREAA